MLLKYSNNQTCEMTVSEVVRYLAEDANKQAALEGLASWRLYEKLCSFRMLITYHFMLDVDAELKVLSETFQRAAVTLCDVIDSYETVTDNLQVMLTTDGEKLGEFWDTWDEDSDSFQGVPLTGYGEGLAAFKVDRCLP